MTNSGVKNAGAREIQYLHHTINYSAKMKAHHKM